MHISIAERMVNMVKEVNVLLQTIDEAKRFVETLTKFDGDFELISGKYIVDAKSILGIFSVDLSKPTLLRLDVDDEKMDDALKSLEAYRVKEAE